MAADKEPVSHDKPAMLPSVHITDQPFTMSNWYKQIEWINVLFVIGIPLGGIIAAYSTPLLPKTALWGLIYYFLTGLGITAGTHLHPVASEFS